MNKYTKKADRSSIELISMRTHDENKPEEIIIEIKDDDDDLTIETRRFIDIITNENEPVLMGSGINDLLRDYANEPLVSLVEACQPIEHLLWNLSFYVNEALRRTPSKPSDGLTVDESASIRLYTSEWQRGQESLYSHLNSILNSGDRQALRPYFKYLKLFLSGLVRLPCVPPSTVWRGVTRNLSCRFPAGQSVTWWAFSSCTTQLPVLKNNKFLGQIGDRTLFSAEVINGRSINKHSNYPNEDEVLLLPATHFIVQSQLSPAANLYVIHLKQIIPSKILLQPPFEGAQIYPQTTTTTTNVSQRHWYQKKRFLIPICFFIVLSIIAIILGSILGSRSTNTQTTIHDATSSSSISSGYLSSLTTFSSYYCRPGVITCSAQFYYEARELTVFTSGYYIITSTNNDQMNPYGYIYQGTLNDDNLLQQNNDINANNQQFQLNLTLESSIRYTLVVTTFEPSKTGIFSIIAIGPGSIDFAQVSITSTYSSEMSNSSSVYCRQNISCSNDSSIFYYKSIPISITTSGYYLIESNSTFNLYGSMYEVFFNPSNPSVNLLQENEVDHSFNQQFLFNVSLTSSTQYFLVVTTIDPQDIGSFFIILTGSSLVNFAETDLVYDYVYSLELSSSSSTYCRYNLSESCASNQLFYYKEFVLVVSLSGCYKIVSSSSMDTFGYFYVNQFNSSNPSINQIAFNDDGGGNTQFELNLCLETLKSYILVVTTYNPNTNGSLSLIGIGPDLIYMRDYLLRYSYIYSSELTYLSSSYLINNSSRYFYQSLTLTVLTTGFYRFQSRNDSTFEIHAFIYQNQFNPLNQSENLLIENDFQSNEFLFNVFLQRSFSYILIVTTYIPYALGSFVINATDSDVIRMK